MSIHLERRRLILSSASASALSLLGMPSARAQDQAGKPIRLVVGFAAGTAPDSVTRSLGRQLEENLRTTVVVDNRPGAGGVLALANVGASPADGTTLLVATVGEIAISPHLYRKIPFDPVRLVPVSEVLTGDVTFVVASQVPVKSMQEFLQWSRGKPTLLIGTFGPGTPHHLVSALLAETTKRKIEPVHYRSVGDALTGLVMGELDGAFVSSALAKAWQQTGKVTVLAVSTPHRSPIFPDVQTLREAGLAGAEFGGWVGVFAPPGTTPEAADKLNASVVAAARAPAVKTAMEALGFTIRGTSREDFERVVASDRARFGKLIESLGLKLD